MKKKHLINMLFSIRQPVVGSNNKMFFLVWSLILPTGSQPALGSFLEGTLHYLSIMHFHSLSLVCLFLSLSPFKSVLKSYQSALLTPGQKSFSHSEKAGCCQESVDLLSYRLSHGQEIQNCISGYSLGIVY